MANDLNRSIKIFIDGTPAAQGIAPIEAAIQKLEAELSALNETEEDYAQKSAKLRKQLDSKNVTLQNYKKKVEETDRVLKNLSGATYNELIAVQGQVRKQLREATPGTEKYTIALEQNKRVATEVAKAQKAMRVEVGCQGTVFGKAAGFVNKYFALFSTAVASVTGLTMTIRRSVEDWAQISEAMAGVKKYTGMTDEEVKNLNEDLKKIDTRTPRERLNELAQDAGRLGIKGKQDILDFVDAADKINVALGKDLGEDAVKNIGKLAQMFGEDQKMGLREAMLATGSAINEVAQNSSASEQYLVDFTAKVAGTGKQAGISQTQIMGFAAVLDQDMQQVEMASTALQTVIMKVYQEPAKFAKMAGKDVTEFTELLKTNANEAILQLLESLGGKGGLQQLAPLFKDMKLDGVRAAGVLNTLAANTERVRQEQERATTAYKDGTSVINEFNVQNNTVQARLEKAKKGFQEISYQLGEKLTPLMSQMITATGFMVRALNTLIGFFAKYSYALVPLCATLTGYILLSKALIVEEKLKVFWSEKVIVSLKRMYAVMLQNPYLALTAVVVTLIATFREMNRELTLGERIANRISDVREKAAIDIARERGELNQYLSIARDENRSKGEREAAIRRINELSPEYLGNITLENINTQEATKSVNKYVDSLIALSEIKQAQQQIEDLKQQKETIRKNGVDTSFLEDAQAGAANMLNQFKTSLGLYTDQWADAVLDKYINKGARELRSIDQEITALNQHIEEGRQKLISLETKDNPHSIVPPLELTDTDDGKDTKKSKARKAALEKEKTLYTQQQADIKNIYAAGYNEELKTEKQYESKMLDLKKEHFKRVVNIAGTGTSEAAEAEKQLADIQIQEQKDKLNILNEKREKELESENDFYNIQKKTFKNQLDSKKITKQQYDVFVAAITSEHSNKILQIEQQYYDKAQRMTETSEGNMAEFIEKSKERITDATQQSIQDRLLAEQTYMANLKAIRDMADTADVSPESKENALYQTKISELEALYQASIDYAQRTGKDTIGIEQEYNAMRENLYQEHNRKLVELNAEKNKELAQSITDPFQQEVMNAYSSIANLQDLMKNFSNYTEKEFKEKLVHSIGQLVNSVTGGLSSAFNTFKQKEIDNIEAKYDAEIAAAAGDAEKIQQLEEEKAQKKLDIEKEYADVQFAIKASQIIANTATAIMTCLAQLGPIAGPIMAGIVTATGITELAAANAERQKVKSMTLGGSSSSSTGEKPTANVTVRQWATGNYDVIGEDDGKNYQNVPYIGDAPTGIVRRTSLISENGAELIVNAEDLNRLQRHVNYPLVLSAIQDARSGHVPQRAKGNYDTLGDMTPEQTAPMNASNEDDGSREDFNKLIALLKELAKALQNVRAYVSLRDIQRAEELDNRSKKVFTKSTK